MKKYDPKPIETEDVFLSEDIEKLMEALAKNTHEVWAKGRMDEGWTYGSVRNDELKQHPCLVPYEELPESEKNYDRHTVGATLKLIIKLGYKVSK